MENFPGSQKHDAKHWANVLKSSWNQFSTLEKVNARTYLQPHYGNGVFRNVYLSAGQH